MDCDLYPLLVSIIFYSFPQQFLQRVKRMKNKLLISSFLSLGISGYVIYANQPEPTSVAAQVQDSNSKPSITANSQKTLWQASQTYPSYQDTLPDEIQVEYIQANPEALKHLSEGQKVSFFIPQEQTEYAGTIEKSYSQFNDKVTVSSGSIEGADKLSSFTVTRGPESTLIMVATENSIYQVEIDNKTGQGTVIDDRSLDYFRKHDDSQLTPPEGLS